MSIAGRLTVLGVLVFAGACGSAVHSEQPCTMIGCQEGLSVDLQASAWPAGSYAFDLTADGKSRHCTATLPLPACNVESISCIGELEATVTVSGCALPAGSQSFGPISFGQGPASVDVSIMRDGTRIGGATLRPTYRVVQPNGSRCEPTCRQASDRVVLSP